MSQRAVASPPKRRSTPRLRTEVPASVAVSLPIPGTPAVRHNEFWRKLLHISPGLLAFALPFAPHARPLRLEALLEITAITIVLTGLYIALKRRVERPDETDFYTT